MTETITPTWHDPRIADAEYFSLEGYTPNPIDETPLTEAEINYVLTGTPPEGTTPEQQIAIMERAILIQPELFKTVPILN